MAGARPTPFAAGALVPNFGIYLGYSLRETSGTAPVVVRLWNNASAASGTLIAAIQIPTSGSKDVSLHDGGLFFDKGCWIEIVSGAAEGSVYIG
jgi:hypothetical protein